MRYKGRASEQTLRRDYPHCVEIIVPFIGFGRKLDGMQPVYAASPTLTIADGARASWWPRGTGTMPNPVGSSCKRAASLPMLPFSSDAASSHTACIVRLFDERMSSCSCQTVGRLQTCIAHSGPEALPFYAFRLR